MSVSVSASPHCRSSTHRGGSTNTYSTSLSSAARDLERYACFSYHHQRFAPSFLSPLRGTAIRPIVNRLADSPSSTCAHPSPKTAPPLLCPPPRPLHP